MAGYKILIIDDDAITAAAIEEYLSDFGYKVYHAVDGDEGIKMIGDLVPDLVLLDINMPGKDGFQTMAEIKSNPETSEIPVLFLSAYDRPNLKVKGLELGAVDYITRPFELAELLARIRVALRRFHRSRKEKDETKRKRTLEGDLSDMGLIELAQSIEMGKKTAVVTLKDLDGELVFESGLLVFARQGNFTGNNALKRILFVEWGEFSVTFDKIPPSIDKQPVQPMKAIMNSVTYLDEVKSMMNNIKPGSAVKITREIKELKGGENFRENAVIPLIRLIIAMEGDLKEIVQLLLLMLEKNKLKLETI